LRTSSAEIVAAATAAIFGQPMITNVFRSVIVEAIVAAALGDAWEWSSADYAACDFKRADGLRLEVKQSSLRQTWSTKLSRPAWDIAARMGYWIGGVEWVSAPGRNADIYVLALHGVTDASADHRDPRQWSFFVVSADCLPDQKTIGLNGVCRLAQPVVFDLLNEAVNTVALKLGMGSRHTRVGD
jgi:hypothetical protein